MIYVGYPCIGKTSIAGRDNFIDLESSLFNDGSKDWADKYIKVADDLSAQGYSVFVSSHKVVRDTLKRADIPFICVFPALTLKNQWYDRLAQRYKNQCSEKNLRALSRWQYFDDDIKDLMAEPRIMVIHDINYDLKEFVCAANIDTQDVAIGFDGGKVYTIPARSGKTITDLWVED